MARPANRDEATKKAMLAVHNIPYDDLRGWIEQVEKLGELRRVTGASWEEEIGMIAEVVCRLDTAPAVLVDGIPGCDPRFRVLINIFAARRKNMSLGFPTDFDKLQLSEGFEQVYSSTDNLIPPIKVENGPVFENVLEGDDINLERFPVPVWHKKDGGRYIGTGSYNVTKDPDEGWVNLGSYRIMVDGPRTVAFNTAPGKHGRIHFEKNKARGEPTPVVMVVGGDPLTFFLSGLEVPIGVSEYDVLGGIRRKPIEVVLGKHTGLPFPANAEIVLEGFVHPEKTVPEGPFGDWVGTYTEKGRLRPMVEVKAIYHRNDPILLGFPPQSLPDEYSRFRAITRSALLKKNIEAAGVPAVTKVWAHEVGGSRMLTGISITQRYPGHAGQAGHIAAQCHVGAYASKWVIVTDEDIDVSNLEDLIWAALTRSDPATSIDFIKIGWTTPSDPMISPERRAQGDISNSRMVINACKPYHWRDEFPEITRPSLEESALARKKYSYLLD